MIVQKNKSFSRVTVVLCCIFFLFYFPASFLCAQTFSTSAGSLVFSHLAGSEKGLHGISQTGVSVQLWDGGAVKKIVKAPDYWAMLTSTGIFVSADLFHWEARNAGLPVKTIKVYDNNEKTFEQMIQDLKDVKIHPENSNMMVTATKDSVFLSGDAGRTWRNLGMPPYQTNGLKAVAVGNMPELTVFVSHSIYGIHYIHPEEPSSTWTEVNLGLEKLETTDNPDEISDITIVTEKTDQGNTRSVVYAGQTFRNRLYQLDWNTKYFSLIWSDDTDFGTVESLNIENDLIRFVSDGVILEKQLGTNRVVQRNDLLIAIQNASTLLESVPECFVFLDQRTPICLSELWLLDESAFPAAPYSAASFGKEGLYLPVNHAMDPTSLKPYIDIIKERNLNMVVIDMKDDYGRLRFTPRNTELTNNKGRVFWPVDIDTFLKTMKDLGVYVAARIVVFKDPELVKKEDGKYAVWDRRNNQAWAGYYETRREKSDSEESANENSLLVQEIYPSDDPQYEIVRTYYDEKWVDPYSEEVWEYNTNVAKELIERGFDEIQFDYIRFPTDGKNLSDAEYRWKEAGMDKESAMLSFLRHARKNIPAPISIDIYGANGWYRTGARTGQEVEMLVHYVDVICPMYYPSHFEQAFLAQNPPEERPYRIYYQGTKRTQHIARGQVVVRSWIQAFYLNVSYDKKYYNSDYVRREIEGVRDAGNPGFTYWNNSGRYEDIPRSD